MELQSAPEKREKAQMTSRRTAWIVVVLALAITSLGGSLLFFGGVRTLLHYYKAQRWSEGRCVLTRADYRVSSGKNKSYSIGVAYQYEVGNKKYTGTRFSPFMAQIALHGPDDRLRQKYGLNQSFSCFYNPKDPAESVLSRAFDYNFIFTNVLATLLFLGGIAMLHSGWRQLTGRTKQFMEPDMPLVPFRRKRRFLLPRLIQSMSLLLLGGLLLVLGALFHLVYAAQLAMLAWVVALIWLLPGGKDPGSKIWCKVEGNKLHLMWRFAWPETMAGRTVAAFEFIRYSIRRKKMVGQQLLERIELGELAGKQGEAWFDLPDSLPETERLPEELDDIEYTPTYAELDIVRYSKFGFRSTRSNYAPVQ